MSELVVLAILQRHQGSQNAVSISDLAREASQGIAQTFADVDSLRQMGYLIIHTEDDQVPSYFIAETQEEWLDFRKSYLLPAAKQVIEISSAMGRAAKEKWPPEPHKPYVETYLVDVEITEGDDDE